MPCCRRPGVPGSYHLLRLCRVPRAALDQWLDSRLSALGSMLGATLMLSPLFA